jgi:uroporphyrinogen-III synthase
MAKSVSKVSVKKKATTSTLKSSNTVTAKKIKKILISQPRPESEKSPYFELERKHGVELHFTPFIQLEAIAAKEFRKQKVDVVSHTGVIFTSKNAIEHFFRLAEEGKLNINQDTKYFCTTEAIALYLQKFILYRKRKVFYGADGSNKSMFDVINKHKENEKILYVCSENQQDNEIVGWLKTNKCEFNLGYMYRTVSNNIKDSIPSLKSFDVICLFTPSGVKSLLDNYPTFKQNGTLVGAFGSNTAKAIEEAGLTLNIKAPAPLSPSLLTALDKYLCEANK